MCNILFCIFTDSKLKCLDSEYSFLRAIWHWLYLWNILVGTQGIFRLWLHSKFLLFYLANMLDWNLPRYWHPLFIPLSILSKFCTSSWQYSYSDAVLIFTMLRSEVRIQSWIITFRKLSIVNRGSRSDCFGSRFSVYVRLRVIEAVGNPLCRFFTRRRQVSLPSRSFRCVRHSNWILCTCLFLIYAHSCKGQWLSSMTKTCCDAFQSKFSYIRRPILSPAEPL